MNEEETKKYCEENLDSLFAFFKLDRRASQKELELAYEVLTKDIKNIPNSIYKEYRKNFEILMTYHFHKKSDFKQDERFMSNEQHFKNVRDNIIPKKLNDIFDETEEEEDITISDRARTILATQRINLVLFTKKITEHCLNIFGFKIWREKDIEKVIKDSCLNSVMFKNIFFELGFNANPSSTLLSEVHSLQDYTEGLKKLLNYNKKTCKYFAYKKTLFGVVGSAILEENLSERFLDMLNNKADITGCYLSVSVDGENQGY